MRTDTYRHKGMRQQLAQLLQNKGITDQKVLQAIVEVPRHLFLDEAFLEHAYEDKAFQIGEGQTISQPYTVAYQSQLLEIKSGDKILEIGTGSGYQASILSTLGARVYSIERQKKLHDKTKKLLQLLGYGNIKTFFGDGFEGIPTYAPFDKAIITAAAPEIPMNIMAQLKAGGFLVIPVNQDLENQQMKRIIKQTDDTFIEEEFEFFKFVPMLKGKVF